eukprot:4230686-Lingulodinium_polyedra.AAC.1
MTAIAEVYPDPNSKRTKRIRIRSVQTFSQRKTAIRRPPRGRHDNRAVTRNNASTPLSRLRKTPALPAACH